MPQVHTTKLKIVRTPTSVEKAARSFLLDREANRCTAATLAWYEQYIGRLVSWLIERDLTELGLVTATHMREYLVDLSKRGLADRTIHHHASAARAFFNFCVDDELLTASPMGKVRMPRLPKEILPAFSAEDVRSLLSACDNERDRAVVLVLLDSGCRLAEFLNLEVGDIDLTAGTVVVRGGKGKKDRTTYIGDQARKHLRRYLSARKGGERTDSALWLVEQGDRPLSRMGLQRLLQRLGERAQVENCTAHTFRRTCAITCLRNGMDLHRLALLLGHSDISVLRKYLDITEHDVQEAHSRYGPVDGLLATRKGRR